MGVPVDCRDRPRGRPARPLRPPARARGGSLRVYRAVPDDPPASPASGPPSDRPAEPRREPPSGTAGAPAGRELRAAARAAWSLAEPRAKAAAAAALGVEPLLGPDPQARFDDGLRPGRPALPRLVHPRDVPQRGAGTADGRAALLHAIAHIEFNAVDLALDAVWRFDGLPHAWYLDWARVAAEEALHFGLLADELERRGHGYGDWDAHDGLWEMAMRTRHDPLARMALVPRLMEARGLDVTPLIQRKLEQAGDSVAV
ncbi:MAG: DUF455 family protein, partial [Burkholderiales bacterium]